MKDGVPVQDDGHYGNSSTASLIVNHFGPGDAGAYQVIVTNAYGAATSQVAQLAIHVVDAAGANPVAPYSTWATAATTIQDAINAASTGDIVLATNGTYSIGGKVMSGDLTNRVALDRAITVMSISGYASTAIQGAWDPITTNGPGAVRCAYVGDGAVLIGFTLQNGATRTTGDSFAGGPLESGGGVWCSSTNGIVANCVLSNNSAMFGAGIRYGTLNNSLVLDNYVAIQGGGAYFSTLNNCTVIYNHVLSLSSGGAGTYDGITQNSIVEYNYDLTTTAGSVQLDNHPSATPSGLPRYSYSCTAFMGPLSGSSNLDVNPQLLDLSHIATTSPCRGMGSPAYASGTDLDGEPWANPPSMGCDEVAVANLTGPLSVNLLSYQTNVLLTHYASFAGFYTGRATASAWFFGDGQTVTNVGPVSHLWLHTGDFTVTYTVYNNDNPAGVSASTVVHVQMLQAPQIQQPGLSTNGFQFQFTSQSGAIYTIQYTTNIMPPVSWKTLRIIPSRDDIIQIVDPGATNMQRFYRVSGQ